MKRSTWQRINTSSFAFLYFDSRSWCPDRTLPQARKYIADTMGERYAEGVILNLEATWEESDIHTPLICFLSMGSDPTGSIESLAKRKGFGKSFYSVSLSFWRFSYQKWRPICILENTLNDPNTKIRNTMNVLNLCCVSNFSVMTSYNLKPKTYPPLPTHTHTNHIQTGATGNLIHGTAKSKGVVEHGE